MIKSVDFPILIGESEVFSGEGFGSETVRRRGRGGRGELRHNRFAGDWISGGGEKFRASVGSETERRRGETEGSKGMGRSILEKGVELGCWWSRKSFLEVVVVEGCCDGVGEGRFMGVAAERGWRRAHEEQSGGSPAEGLRQRVEKREWKGSKVCSGFWSSEDSWIRLLMAAKDLNVDDEVVGIRSKSFYTVYLWMIFYSYEFGVSFLDFVLKNTFYSFKHFVIIF